MMKYDLLVAVLVFEVVLCTGALATGPDNDRQLRKMLFDLYNKSQAPPSTKNGISPVALRLEVSNFNGRNSIAYPSVQFTVTGFLFKTWTDERLKWEPSAFYSVERFLVDNSKIWKPDIKFKTTIETDTLTCRNIVCLVRHQGNVTCMQRCSSTVNCKSNVRYWPFERSTCTLNLVPWYNLVDTQVVLSSFDAAVSRKTSLSFKHWKVISMETQLDADDTTIVKGKSIPQASVQFILDKIDDFHIIIFLTPALVLAAMNLLVFWLSPTNIIRYIILLVVMMSHLITLQRMSWNVPKDGDQIPIYLTFTRDALIVTTFTILFITLSLHLSSRKNVVPGWIDETQRKVVTLPYLTFINSFECIESLKPFTSEIEDPAHRLQDSTGAIQNRKWKGFVSLLERIVFFVILLIYIILYVSLIPSEGNLPVGDVKVSKSEALMV